MLVKGKTNDSNSHFLWFDKYPLMVHTFSLIPFHLINPPAIYNAFPVVELSRRVLLQPKVTRQPRIFLNN